MEHCAGKDAELKYATLSRPAKLFGFLQRGARRMRAVALAILFLASVSALRVLQVTA